MGSHQMLVTKDRYPRDCVHVFRMEEVHKLREVRDIVALSGSEGVVESDVNDAVAVFDVEYNRVAANFTPVTDDADAMITARHHAGQINGANFEISCNRHRFLYNCGF